MVMSELVYMHLITHKRKVLAEPKNEVLNIRDYRIFYNPLVNVLWISFVKFLYIDEVKQVIVLEHGYCLQSMTCRRHALGKIAWHLRLVVEQVSLEVVTKSVFIPMQSSCLMDVEYTLFESLCL